MFGGFDFAWPPPVRSLYNMFSLLNFNFELLAPECSLSVNFEAKWCVGAGSVAHVHRGAGWEAGGWVAPLLRA